VIGAGHVQLRRPASASKVTHTMRPVKPLPESRFTQPYLRDCAPNYPMPTSISRFARISRLGFLVLAVLAITGVSTARARAQSQAQSQSQSQQQPAASQDQTPSSQSGSSVPDKPAAPDPKAKKKKEADDPPESKLHITVVSAENGKPVGSASVYIRYPEGKTFFLHKDKEAEENFKTNQDGSLKVPSVPRGKILIQVIAPGWHTYGKYYDIDKDEMEIQIKLEKPPHWY
jgi:hypothetical protein